MQDKDGVGKSEALCFHPGSCATPEGRGGCRSPGGAPFSLMEWPGCSGGFFGILLPRMSEAVENGA